MFNVRRRLNRMPTAARYGTLIAAVALAAGVLVPMTAPRARPSRLAWAGVAHRGWITCSSSCWRTTRRIT